MRQRILVSALGAGALAVAGLTVQLTGAAAAPSPYTAGKHATELCAAPASAHAATCNALKLVDDKGVTPATTTPPATGLTPAGLRDAYKLTGLSAAGRTVAIVDAYGYPNLERDLGVYRAQFGLPACTTANGCLRVINQTGGTTAPRFDAGWAGEQALDVDAVSATAPDAKILVVQANSASFADLGTAVVTASKQPGVVAISNSYSGGDVSDAAYGSYYNHPGIAITASTGDKGYQGAPYPAASAYVTGVGGTSLARSSTTRGWTETAWSGAGSGCSAYNSALTVAASYDTGCAKRAGADVSAAADPNTGGMAIYYPTTKSSSTWAQFGGTSESAPIIAAVYALSGNTAGYPNSIPYTNPGALFDVTSGSNGTCPTTQWCTARTGWDGPTGLGTPNGAGAF
ncbi:S53 family peptidase [Kribbella sp. ALI-6-A]|uniref:S53 family peptidase n=1 Tax=Kribbella sp. ALI-6-A TaxID=1933817 RepID=UPI00192CF510|nr:hypothetical protein [Kribbella sp. ALI-6-A]